MTERRSQSSLSHVKSKIKVVFLGDQSTGKTSILVRFISNKFEQGQGVHYGLWKATVGIDFMAKNISVENKTLRLQLWDTAGQERFRSLIPSYLKDATVTFIVFDITNIRSFQSIGQWIELCNQNRKQKSITFLVGNKADLKEQREVSKELIEQRAQAEGLKYFEVSAKDNTNVLKIFEEAAKAYVEQTYYNETTIGNIENLHEVYLSKLQEDKKKSPDQGNEVVLGKPTKEVKPKSKNSCC